MSDERKELEARLAVLKGERKRALAERRDLKRLISQKKQQLAATQAMVAHYRSVLAGVAPDASEGGAIKASEEPALPSPHRAPETDGER